MIWTKFLQFYGLICIYYFIRVNSLSICFKTFWRQSVLGSFLGNWVLYILSQSNWFTENVHEGHAFPCAISFSKNTSSHLSLQVLFNFGLYPHFSEETNELFENENQVHFHSTKTHSFEKVIINDNCNFMVESAGHVFAS